MTGTAPHQPGGYPLRPATRSDTASVAALVDAAYGHYDERIGMLPRPMTDDYAAVIRDRQVTVAEHDGAIVGVVVLTVTDEGFLIDNVAVHPSRRGTGLGRALLQFAEAEARRAGFDAIHLYTHEQMTENLALYSRDWLPASWTMRGAAWTTTWRWSSRSLACRCAGPPEPSPHPGGGRVDER